jgi:hypothetical protein
VKSPKPISIEPIPVTKFQDRVPAHWNIQNKNGKVKAHNYNSKEAFEGTRDEFIARL